ncbi:MAG: PSD1 and planctomycete cytochrome C domain-containing protein [Planctomycetota bacterium]
MSRFRWCLIPLSAVAIGICCSLAGVRADEDVQPATAEGIQFFESRIRPVLIEHCAKCHSTEGGQGVRGGLSISSREALRIGGESGPAVVPGDLSQSLLWDAINHNGLRMPPSGKLPAETIRDFRRWIEMGAPDPRVPTEAVVQSRVTPEAIAEGRSFWAFKSPQMPSIPQGSAWSLSAVDRLIESQFAAHQLTPAADAAPAVLLRRLHIALTGLPPAPEQLDAFHAEWSRDPRQTLAVTVDSLLSSPQFGERWGRHWLDAVRYAESTGKEIDVSFPNAWRYRDYVIDAFNADKPYDAFIREQLAGDLLPAPTDEEWARQLIATGFLALGPRALIEQNPRQFQADLVDEQIDVTTRVFLGVSVACARCHDHKFDPIPQSDYYALAGIFQSTETCFGGVRSQRNRQPSKLIVLPIDDPNPSDQPMTREELAELKKQRDEVQQEAIEARRALARPQPGGTPPQTRVANQFLLDQRATQLTTRINSVDENGKPLTVCMGVQDRAQPKNARLLIRGEIDQMAQEVPRGFVQVLSSADAILPPDSSGRLELADWIASPSNPLTARVMVNRVWLHLMGQALVRETDNFGASGPKPANQALLDYLAVRFVDSGWSVKRLIREIVLSRVYGLSSEFSQDRFERDPENQYFARANVRRMEAEVIRDSMLAASGQLDLQRPRGSVMARFTSSIIGPDGPIGAVMAPPAPGMNGPSTPQTPGRPGLSRRMGQREGDSMMAGGLFPRLRGRMNGGGGSVFEASVPWRSVYLPVPRNSVPRSLDVFDFAEPSMVIGQRETSNTPAQALYLLNNTFVLEQSDALARRLQQSTADRNDRITQAFLLVFGRQPEADELHASLDFLDDAEQSGNSAAALSSFCQALFASAEFRYVN